MWESRLVDVRSLPSPRSTITTAMGVPSWFMVDRRHGESSTSLSATCKQNTDCFPLIQQTLELLEGKNLFDPIDRVHGQYVIPLALAQYIGYLGPPPLKIIQQSPLFSTYFDAEGKSQHPTIQYPLLTEMSPQGTGSLSLRSQKRLLKTLSQQSRRERRKINFCGSYEKSWLGTRTRGLRQMRLYQMNGLCGRLKKFCREGIECTGVEDEIVWPWESVVNVEFGKSITRAAIIEYKHHHHHRIVSVGGNERREESSINSGRICHRGRSRGTSHNPIKWIGDDRQ